MLFRGRSQLLIYHFMFGPDYTAGCPSCSAIGRFQRIRIHLANHDVMLWASRGRHSQAAGVQETNGSDVSLGLLIRSEFNFDFNTSFTEEQQRNGIEYTYERESLSRRYRQARPPTEPAREPP